ncbi:MAG: hypothetical protein ACO1QB_12380 [Verrucomicrobiales bacterium]
MKLLTVIACTFAWFAATANVSASCCDNAKKEGKECSHKCCVDAAKDKKVCEKCNPKKSDKKDAKKEDKKS